MVKVIMANNDDLGPERIRAQLEKALTELKLEFDEGDLPHPRTIARIKARFGDGERESYKVVRWPDTFEAGLLPWDAAPFALAVMRRVGRMSSSVLGQDGQPTVRHVFWAWQISRARASEAYDREVWRAAGYMGMAEAAPLEQAKVLRQAVEDWLLKDTPLPDFVELEIDYQEARFLAIEMQTAQGAWFSLPGDDDYDKLPKSFSQELNHGFSTQG